MASLSNTKISDTYPLLLKIETNGVDGTLRSIEDGDGTTSALKISSGAIQVDNIKVDGNAITSTDTDGNIDLTPNGSGEVNISKVDIDSGAIDGTPIGANSANTGAFTTLTVDDITINGSTISDSGDLTLDIGADIILDAGGNEIKLKSGGTEWGQIYNSSSDLAIYSSVQDKDILFQGNHGGSLVTALTIDMSEGGLVGIGTTSPNTALHLKFTDNTTNAADNSSLTHSSGIYINNESTTNEAHSSIGFRTNNLDGALSMIYGGSANEGRMSVNMEGAERLSVTHDGKVFIGSTSSRALSGVTPQMQIEGTDYSTSSMSLIGNTGTDAGTCPLLMFGRSRGTSDGTSTSVADGDRLGAIFFTGADGTDINTVGAYIETRVDGSVSGNTMPGRIQFYTNSGGSSASEKMRITSAGHVEMLEDKRISIGTWDNSGFTGSNAYGLSIDSELPIVHMSDTDTNKKAFFGLSGDNMYIGGNPVDDMIFQTGSGVERMRILSDGRVAIKATSLPEDFGGERGHLCISSTDNGSANNYAILQLQGHTIANDVALGAIHFYDHSSSNASIQANRQNNSGSAKLMFNVAESSGTKKSRMIIYDSGRLVATATNTTAAINTAHTFYINQADSAMVIDNESSGNAFGLQVRYSATGHGTSGYFISCYANPSGSLQARFIVAEDGDVTNSNNSYGSISDQRVKKDITDANSQWNDIKALKIRNYKKDEAGDGSVQIGVVAQELEEAGMNGLVDEAEATDIDVENFPNINEGDKIKSVKYSVLYMKAIKALQESISKIETLESKVEALENA